MTKLEQLQQRLEEIDNDIEPLQAERDAVQQHILTAQSQFKVGDAITWKSYGANPKAYAGRVIRIRAWCSEPMWVVQRIRKDGTEGREVAVRPYDKPTKLT